MKFLVDKMPEKRSECPFYIHDVFDHADCCYIKGVKAGMLDDNECTYFLHHDPDECPYLMSISMDIRNNSEVVDSENVEVALL